MPFKALKLSDAVLRGVQAAGYTDPTPIQLRSIPVVLDGGDLIASAQTGTGKTAAFALPILSKLGAHGRARVLVLEPTRELAAQVETAFRDFARFTDIRTVAIFGGVGYGHQRTELKRGVDVIVATPGRLMDYLKERTLSLQDINILVLDEVDRMLDMGFLPVVKDIIARCPRERQTLFFSATVPPEIAAVAPVKDERWVRCSNGEAEKRIVIETPARLGATEWRIELTLASRDVMGFRMLLGREAIRRRFVIDPGRSFRLSERHPAVIESLDTISP